jgi:hypothetical protein
MGSYDQIYLLVEPVNDYIRLYPANRYVIGTSSGAWITLGISEGISLPIGPTTQNYIYNNLNITINTQDGSILNNMQKAGEFLSSIYSGNIPFTIEKVPVFRRHNNPNMSETRFTPIHVNVYNPYPLTYSSMGFSASIIIDTDYAPFPNSSLHEYGHYVQFRMWNGTGFDNDPYEVQDGWAMFFGFAAGAYCSNIYGDTGNDLFRDNLEEGGFWTNRFSTLSYYNLHPSWPAFACYLYNLYDVYDDGIYEFAQFKGKENEDVFGLRRRVFDVMAAVVAPTSNGFNTRFKSGLNTNLQNSIQKIYDYMMLANKPLPFSPQVDNFTANFISQTNIQFNWNRQDYQTSQANLPLGYKLYTRSAIINPWVLLATLPISTTSHNFSTSYPKSLDYKITSYNATGESYNEKYIKYILNVNISGPSLIHGPSSGYFTGSASGGSGIYSYKWSVRYISGDPYLDIGYSKNFTFHPDFTYSNAELLLQVTCGEQRGYITKSIQLTGSGGPIEMAVPDFIPGDSSSIYLAESFQVFNEPQVSFSVSPNPTSGIVRISSSNGAMINKISLLNASGVVIQRILNVNCNRYSLDLAGLIDGIYKAQVEIDGIVSSKNIIKQ